MYGQELTPEAILSKLKDTDYTIEKLIESAALLRQGDDEKIPENMSLAEEQKYDSTLRELAYWSDAVAHHAQFVHEILDDLRFDWQVNYTFGSDYVEEHRQKDPFEEMNRLAEEEHDAEVARENLNRDDDYTEW